MKTKMLNGIDVTIRGLTYDEHKECAREIGRQYQGLYDEGVSLSWAEVAEWSRLLSIISSRYGLGKEFAENGIL